MYRQRFDAPNDEVIVTQLSAGSDQRVSQDRGSAKSKK